MAKHTSISPFAKIRTSKIGTITIEQNKTMGTPCAHLFSAKPEDSFIVDPHDSLDSWTQLIEACPRVADGKNRDRITLNQPLIITWVMESYSGKEVPIIRSIHETPSVATNATFPTWCKSVEELGNWLRDQRAGEVWAREALGADPAQWPSKEECEATLEAVRIKPPTAQQPKSELDEFLGPKKEKPMPDTTVHDLEVVTPAAADVDELAPDESKQEQHWSASRAWRAQLNDIKTSRTWSDAWTSKEWEDWCHQAVKVNSFKELPNDAFAATSTLSVIQITFEEKDNALIASIKDQIRDVLSPLAPVTVKTVSQAIGYGGDIAEALQAGNSVATLLDMCHEFVKEQQATKNAQEPANLPNAATVAPNEAQDATAAKIEAESMVDLPTSTTVTIEGEIVEAPKALTVVDAKQTAQANLFPVASEWQTMKEIATTAIKSGLLPKGIKTPEAALYIIETGRELGIHPTLALRKIQIIQGQPTLAAELMLALVKRSKELEYISIQGDETQCTVIMRRKGEGNYTEVFTMDMARKMMSKEWDEASGKTKTIPLAEKFNWRSMPATMLKWRAVSAACRTVFPDITLGIYTSEEMSDNLDITGTAA